MTRPRSVWLSRAVLVGCALVLLVGAGACARACSNKSRADSNLPDAAGEDPRVEMLSTGREPRVRLEVARWTGFSYRIELESETHFGFEGQAPGRVPTALATLRFDVTRGMGDPLVRKRQGEELRLIDERATIEDLSVRGGAAPPEFNARFNELLRGLRGTTTRHLIAEDGEVVEMKTELVGGAKPSAEVQVALDAAWDLQRRFPFRLPRQPVGVGARWRFSEPVEFRGVRAMQVAEMFITTLDDSAAKIRLRVRHHAPRQELPHPLNPKDTAMLEQYRGDGEGEVTVDRNTAVWLESRLATTAILKLTAYAADGAPQTASFAAASTTRSRGRIVDSDAAEEQRVVNDGASAPPPSAAPAQSAR